MSTCEKIEKCPFFNDKLSNMPSIAETLKGAYCQTSQETCARYQVAAQGLQVPPFLFPNDARRAQELLASVPAGR